MTNLTRYTSVSESVVSNQLAIQGSKIREGMLLRPRQKELVLSTLEALMSHGNTLAVAPTGAGKTIMLSAVLGRLFKLGIESACVVAHRDELTAQNIDKFMRVNPHLSTSIFDSKQKSWEGQVVFAMIGTISNFKNLNSMPHLDVLVIDEAHHARAKSYMRVIEHAQHINPEIKILGMTATPNRSDKKGLRPIFSNVSDQITIKELIASGHLVPPRTFVQDVGVAEKLRKVRISGLDYDMESVAQIINTRPINREVVKHWKEKAGDRQTVVFCSTVNHARDVNETFNKAEINSSMIWGNMREIHRSRILKAYCDGDIQVIVNVAVLNEGWDHPPTSCIVLLRPSSSKSAMIQMIGRGLRVVDQEIYTGITKRDCIVLDFGTSTQMHGTLEQTVKLDDQLKKKGAAPYKECPECEAEVPLASMECPLCGHLFERLSIREEAPATNSRMVEIDMLRRSNFEWCDLLGNDRYFIASGFKAWGGVFCIDNEWYSVGGRNNNLVKLLAVGERLVCFASANDWINLYETETTAHKNSGWLNSAPTKKQLNLLSDKDQKDKSLTRYKASCLITLRKHKRLIIQAINRKET